MEEYSTEIVLQTTRFPLAVPPPFVHQRPSWEMTAQTVNEEVSFLSVASVLIVMLAVSTLI